MPDNQMDLDALREAVSVERAAWNTKPFAADEWLAAGVALSAVMAGMGGEGTVLASLLDRVTQDAETIDRQGATLAIVRRDRDTATELWQEARAELTALREQLARAEEERNTVNMRRYRDREKAEAAFRAEVQRGKQDRERLDWLDKQPGAAASVAFGHQVLWHNDGRVSLRAAIDAALASATPSPTEEGR